MANYYILQGRIEAIYQAVEEYRKGIRLYTDNNNGFSKWLLIT